MSFSSATLLFVVCSSLLAPCSDETTPHDAGLDAGLDADPFLACPADYLLASQVRGATPSPDGLGWCCPPAETPSCECTPTGGFVAERCDCAQDYGLCDGHPNDWTRVTDEHGCDHWRVGVTHSCTGPDSGAASDVDAGTDG